MFNKDVNIFKEICHLGNVYNVYHHLTIFAEYYTKYVNNMGYNSFHPSSDFS